MVERPNFDREDNMAYLEDVIDAWCAFPPLSTPTLFIANLVPSSISLAGEHSWTGSWVARKVFEIALIESFGYLLAQDGRVESKAAQKMELGGLVFSSLCEMGVVGF